MVIKSHPTLEHFTHMKSTPDNIALVCKMAAYIGLEKDFVFKETAQRIVPDIGVLQHFSPVPFTHFSMSFVNSMSANERLATIENWRRLDLFGLSKDPSKQTIALINNRNDRVARSKVFAQMLVEDLPFDKMVVIGTNVDGFYSYYLHAFAERFERIISNNDLQELELLCSQLHCIKEADTVAEIMNKALEGSYQAKEFTALNNAEQFTDWLNGQAQTLSEQQRISLQDVFNHYLSYQQMRPLLSDLKKNQHNLQTILLELVKSKCILITNSKVTPDQLTIMLTALARPHCHQVIIGMQNIKGAGLGYVYGWQQWQKIYDSISMLLDNNCSAEQFKKTLTRLSLISTFSQLEHAYLSSALLEIKKMHHAQNEYSQAELVHINERLNKHQQQLDNKTDSQQQGPLKRFAIQVAESFLDAGAAVKRKKIANQVYKDIATQRITLEKAITVLGKLNRNQKPGWLTFSNKDNS
ncbi:hypothetical protein [Pseudoalteromonas sp. B160]|uniref:hypothetical protein n=1 Tax=Pseudoalteromonas sp. B160 TaxID=630414 RepID=UPI00301D4BF1